LEYGKRFLKILNLDVMVFFMLKSGKPDSSLSNFRKFAAKRKKKFCTVVDEPFMDSPK
jgi:hypothetical protein